MLDCNNCQHMSPKEDECGPISPPPHICQKTGRQVLHMGKHPALPRPSFCPELRVLRINLIRKWFDLIASGEKPTEFRDYTDYWKARLLTSDNKIRIFDEVWADNGMNKGRLFLRAEWKGLKIAHSAFFAPMHGEPLEPGKHYFGIGLGRILEVGNRGKS